MKNHLVLIIKILLVIDIISSQPTLLIGILRDDMKLIGFGVFLVLSIIPILMSLKYFENGDGV